MVNQKSQEGFLSRGSSATEGPILLSEEECCPACPACPEFRGEPQRRERPRVLDSPKSFRSHSYEKRACKPRRITLLQNCWT
jgi:hypothetical protein